MDPDLAGVLIDFTNAFNLVNRDFMLQTVKKVCPEILNLITYIYADAPLLFIGKEGKNITSQQGVKQGCALGSLVFSIALQEFLNVNIITEIPNLKLNVWYLDDGTLIGNTDDILKVVKIFQEKGPAHGFLLNSKKTIIFGPGDVNTRFLDFPEDIIRTSTDDGKLKLLGVSLLYGTSGEVLGKTVRKIKEDLSRLKDVGDSQTELILTRFCLGLPQFRHALCSTHPKHIQIPINEFDEIMKENLKRIIGSDIDETIRDRIALPTQLGGMGIPKASDIALATYLASSINSRDMTARILGISSEQLMNNIESTLVDFNSHFTLTNGQQLLETLLASNNTNKMLTTALNTENVERLKTNLVNAGRYHELQVFDATSSPEAMSFLNVLPIQNLNLFMDDMSYKYALKQVLGLPVYSKSSLCNQCKVANNDFNGIHAQQCGSGLTSRHNILKSALGKIAIEAGLTVKYETPNLLPGSNDRPADITIVGGFEGIGKDIAVDVTIKSGFVYAGSIINMMDKAAEDKYIKYGERCRLENIEFRPFVMNSMGGLQEEALDLIRLIAIKWGPMRRQNVNVAERQIKQRLCFAVKKSEAYQFSIRDDLVSEYKNSFLN
jgi:ribosomal protein S13